MSSPQAEGVVRTDWKPDDVQYEVQKDSTG